LRREWKEISVGTTADDAGNTPDREVTAEPVTPDLELTLPSRPENVAVVRHALGGFGDALDVPDQALADIKLAVTEACTNVVVHAYPEGEGPLGISAWVRDGRLTVVVHDQGQGMLPRPDSPGLGLGLPLIATLAESLELGTGINERTEVRMTFLLTDAEAA
jgi:anti-sigma regulatory factor (Ser/Thr protein kinase)